MSLGLKHWKIILTLIILMCGDVEKNPGPYKIAGIVQASFSQGHEKFGVTRGIQCTCISLYSVCFSSIKLILEWLSEDLEYIIVKGDKLYAVSTCTVAVYYTLKYSMHGSPNFQLNHCLAQNLKMLRAPQSTFHQKIVPWTIL